MARKKLARPARPEEIALATYDKYLPIVRRTIESLSVFAPELRRSLEVEILAHSVRVAVFFHGLIVVRGRTDLEPQRLGRRARFDLAAALLFLEWEGKGIHVHLEAGLPSGKDALFSVLPYLLPNGPTQPDDDGETLFGAAIDLFMDRLAWEARLQLGAVVAMNADIDDGVLVDAIARLLWSRRKAARIQQGTQK